jgi:recombinational DNA repair ATPase RecF
MLSGKNGQGKSLILDAITLCWRGAKFSRESKVSAYVKQGEQAASVKMKA